MSISVVVDQAAGPFAFPELEQAERELKMLAEQQDAAQRQVAQQYQQAKVAVLNRIASVGYALLPKESQAVVERWRGNQGLSVSLERRGIDGPGQQDSALYEICFSGAGAVAVSVGSPPAPVSTPPAPAISEVQLAAKVASYGLSDEERIVAMERIMALASNGVSVEQAVSLYESELEAAVKGGIPA